MLAGFERRDGHFGVKLVGRGDRDHVHLGIVDQVAPVAGRFLETQFVGAFLGKLRARLRKMDNARSRHAAEDRVDRVPGERVAFAHIAGADQPHPYAVHVDFLRPRMLYEITRRDPACLIQASEITFFLRIVSPPANVSVHDLHNRATTPSP
jgi:hypothetical protein